MTDKEKLVLLLSEWGVGFTELSKDKKTNMPEPHKSLDIVRCKDGDNNVGGYAGFMVNFEFDERGKFVAIMIWE